MQAYSSRVAFMRLQATIDPPLIFVIRLLGTDGASIRNILAIGRLYIRQARLVSVNAKGSGPRSNRCNRHLGS